MVKEVLYDGQTYKQALKAAETVLEKRIDELNSLNVFPVPDGDTGINMYLTMKAATESVESVDSTSVAEVSAKAARGALLGARGNSGVLLSQILRGIAKGLEMRDRFTSSDFAQALRHASDQAYRSITAPAEGTILTVIREAAEAAHQQVERGANLKKTIAAVVTQARATVRRTPELLPQLKEAGVVDAGGKGLFYVFLGMKNTISQKLNQFEEHLPVARIAGTKKETVQYGYDLQFLIEGNGLPIFEIRDKVTGMGESVLVVGDEKLIRVHIHTKDTQAVMDYCSSKGILKDIVRENMDEQAVKFKKARKAVTRYPIRRSRQPATG